MRYLWLIPFHVLQWPTLPESRHYAEAPSHYVSHLLG